MNCPNCGTSNLDNASVCVNCGRSLSSGAPSSYTPPPPPPSDFTRGAYGSPGAPPPAPPASNTAVIVYLVLSILQLLCCCNPIALVPLIFAIMSISNRNSGDYAGAQVNAGRTTLWFWIALAAAIVWNIVFFAFFGGAAFLEEMQRNMGR